MGLPHLKIPIFNMISTIIIIHQIVALKYMSYVLRLLVDLFGSMDVGCKLTQGLVDLADEAKIKVEASIPGQWGNGAIWHGDLSTAKKCQQ
jgi:hypothetical protein